MTARPQNRLIVVEPGEHSPLGPSSSDRWIACPGSVKATKDLPGESTEFTASGSAWHALAEICRREGVVAHAYRDWTIRAEGRDFKVDDEFAYGVQEYLDKCDETAPVGSIGLSEVRVEYSRWVPGGFGTTDDLRLHPDVIRDTDLKSGKGVQVWAAGNSQIRLYGLGAYEGFRWLGYDPKKFILAIHQPPLNHYDEEEISTKELLDWAGDVLPVAVREVQEGTRFQPGPHCKFCKIRGPCRVRVNAALAVVLKDFDDLDAVEERSRMALNDLMSAQLTPDELAKLLPALDNIKKWAKHVEMHATKSLIDGKPVGDWKLVEGRSNRKFDGTDEEVAAKLMQHGVREEDCYKPKELRSPAQVETAIGKKAFKPIEKALVKKPPGKPKLAPGSDKRPAMTHSVLEEFSNLDLDEDE